VYPGRFQRPSGESKGENIMSDPILLWNKVALEANRVSHTNGKGEQLGPTLSSRALAIVHLAMYDAYAGVIQDATNLPPYLAGLPAPGAGASVDAAIAAAAHATLANLFPSQKPFFDFILAGAGDTSNPGHSFGLTVAQSILDDRKDDPGAGAGGYIPSAQRGRHRPDPDNLGQGFHAPFYGAQSKGFAITDRHELAPPPFDNNEYRKALREARGRGIAPELMGTLPGGIKARTVDQTLIGIFWAYDGVAELGTPPRLYNQIIHRVAKARCNSVEKNARLFAFVNVAMADAGILAWDQKYIHDFWRPVVGIREHDQSMGPAATQADNNISDNCDSSWLPLGAPATNSRGKNVTPPFPAYPSGHATFGAAALHIARLFYGVPAGHRQRDDLFQNLDFVSDELNGMNTDNRGTVRVRHLRHFPDGLWQMIEENGRSRVYLGVHWVFDAFAVKDDGTPDLSRQDDNKYIGGVPLGLQIAEDIFQAGGGKAPQKSTVPPRS
jgi:vanadium chloroperoxidase